MEREVKRRERVKGERVSVKRRESKRTWRVKGSGKMKRE